MRCAWGCGREATEGHASLAPCCDDDACLSLTVDLDRVAEANRLRYLGTFAPLPPRDSYAAHSHLAPDAARCDDLDGPADASGWTIW